jgi:hypothetical protein
MENMKRITKLTDRTNILIVRLIDIFYENAAECPAVPVPSSRDGRG